MRELINKKLKGLSELTEHTIAYEIEPPKEILRRKLNKTIDRGTFTLYRKKA